MKQDINNMIEFIEKELENNNLQLKDFLREIIETLKANPAEDEIEVETLRELYKFTKLGETKTSLDPRGDNGAKISALNTVKKAIESNTLTKEAIESLKSINENCLTHFLNPLILEQQARKFYSENPGAKF